MPKQYKCERYIDLCMDIRQHLPTRNERMNELCSWCVAVAAAAVTATLIYSSTTATKSCKYVHNTHILRKKKRNTKAAMHPPNSPSLALPQFVGISIFLILLSIALRINGIFTQCKPNAFDSIKSDV